MGGAVAAGAVALALATALPPSLANLSSEVSDGTTPVPIGGHAEVIVPADWIITRDGSEALTVRTPDGVLHATLVAMREDAAAAVDGTEGVDGVTRSEQLASGMTAVHADLADGGLVAAVEAPEGRECVQVVVEFRAADADDLAVYRPAVGDLLEGIRA